MPGLAPEGLDPALSAATDGLVSVVIATTEIGANRVEPSHVLVALARIPGGLVARLMVREGISPDVLVEALRAEVVPGTDPPLWTSLDEAALSEHTQAWCAAVAAATAPVDERTALIAVIDHLEPAARRLLEDFGGVDLAAWRDEARAVPAAAAPAVDEQGRLDLERFTPSARAVLAVLRTEAADGGYRDPGTLLLLQAMAVTPQGLVEQAAVFLGFDLRDARTRIVLLLRRGQRASSASDPGSNGDPVDPRSVADFSDALRAVLEQAAVLAGTRGSDIGEPELLEALLGAPSGPAEAVLRAAGVETVALRRFASTLYHPAAAAPSSPERESAQTVTAALDRFRAALIGQPDALERLTPLVETIKRAVRRGFRLGERPLATLLFCGPSGTGKTMTARLLADAIHGSPEELIVFEMGQFNTRESMSTFVGAPPGYVGFGEGQLTNGLARKPRCVLLFDEVEKADPLVLDALLRLLDQGRINDPAGPVRDARETVVVLTSNLGASEFAELTRRRLQPDAPSASLSRALDAVLGGTKTDGGGAVLPAAGTRGGVATDPGEQERQVRARLREELEGFFRPEFLNRIDEIVLFAPFGTEELHAIARAALTRRAEDVREGLGVTLVWDDDVPDLLTGTAIRDRAEEAARGVNRSVDALLSPVLRSIDEAEEHGRATERLRLVVRGDALEVVPDE